MDKNSSDVFLVRGSLQLLEPGEDLTPTSTLLFWAVAGGTAVWQAPEACHVVNVMNVGGSTQLCLSVDGSTYTQNFAAAGNGKFGTVIYLGGTTLGQNFPQNFPLSKNQKIFFTNNGSSNGSMLVILSFGV